MSDMVFNPPAPASPPGATVHAGPFWPEIDLNDFRDTMRVGGTTPPDPRLIAAITGAILTVTGDLTDWRTAQETLGHAALSEVPSEAMGTDTRLVLIWRRAVYAYAAADLVETHRDISATKAGFDRAEEPALTADDHRRNGLHAVRDLKGLRRIRAALI